MKILNERGLAQALRVFETHGWRAGRLVASGDRKLVRLFFYLQVWRTSICDKTLKLLAETAENLRQIILNYETVDENEITHFPLSVTYLETVGDEHEYTTNIVSYTSDKNPNLIFIIESII